MKNEMLENMKEEVFENEGVKCFLTYYVYCGDEIVADEQLEWEFGDEDILQMAELYKEYKGREDEVNLLGEYMDGIIDMIDEFELPRLFPDAEDYFDYHVEVDETLPDDLWDAICRHLKGTDIDQTIYLNVDGQDVEFSTGIGISLYCQNKMRDVLMTGPYEGSDYEALKAMTPDAYNEIWGLISECAFKYSVSHYGEPKEFHAERIPMEVLEEI